MWERWKKGQSLQLLTQLFDREHLSIQRILAEKGRDTSAGAPSLTFGPDLARTRGDLAYGGGRALDPVHWSRARSSSIDYQP